MPSIVPKWARNNRAYGSFRRTISNHPRTLLLKILLLQLIFWANLVMTSVCLSFMIAPSRGPFALFYFDNVGIFKDLGTTIYSLAFLLNACIGYTHTLDMTNYHTRGIVQRFIVDRGRMCLDFSMTCLIVHYLVSAVASKSIPWRMDVYGVFLGAVALMTTVGVTLCHRKELMPILITSDNQQVLLGKKTGSNENIASKWSIRLFGSPGL